MAGKPERRFTCSWVCPSETPARCRSLSPFCQAILRLVFYFIGACFWSHWSCLPPPPSLTSP